MSPNKGTIKYRDEDFRVREGLVVELCRGEESDVEYLLLRKRGYTTMEAVGIVAAACRAKSQDVTYAGLKDEDGITEQLIAIPTKDAAKLSETLGEDWPLNIAANGRDRWIELSKFGYGNTPLRIGGLQGNGFRIVVRDLSAQIAKSLTDERKINWTFINYYDIQRFGVPGGPKRTHHVGASMLAKNWPAAIEELRNLGAPESQAAQQWQTGPAGFFDSLDPRTASFYLAAQSSSDWNAVLQEMIRSSFDASELINTSIEGVPFIYFKYRNGIDNLVAKVQNVPYRRYSFTNGEVDSVDSSRPGTIQCIIEVGDMADDEFHPGRHRITLSFFLPSGCYATSAIRQLLIATEG